ncbi:hypothetical protein MRX96_017451 [Rhipicephalus microplus]
MREGEKRSELHNHNGRGEHSPLYDCSFLESLQQSLHANNCRWLRPGVLDVIEPKVSPHTHPAYIAETVQLREERRRGRAAPHATLDDAHQPHEVMQALHAFQGFPNHCGRFSLADRRDLGDSFTQRHVLVHSLEGPGAIPALLKV